MDPFSLWLKGFAFVLGWTINAILWLTNEVRT